MSWGNVVLRKMVKEGRNIEDKFTVNQLLVLVLFVYLKEDHV